MSVESSGNRYAINDNTSGRSYEPTSLDEAVAIANDLVFERGHSVDLGLAQINSMHLSEFGLTPRDLFDPCENMLVSDQILHDDYVSAEAQFGAGLLALLHAISAYNTGSLWAGEYYVRKVLIAAGLDPSNLNAAPPVPVQVTRAQHARAPASRRLAVAPKRRVLEPSATVTYTDATAPIVIRVSAGSTGSTEAVVNR